MQITSGRWCAPVLASLPLKCSSLLLVVLGATPHTSWDRSYVHTTDITTSTTREHQATASHAERAHAGLGGEHEALRWTPVAPTTGAGLLLHKLLGNTPSNIRRGV
jgi:hypothetical protein